MEPLCKSHTTISDELVLNLAGIRTLVALMNDQFEIGNKKLLENSKINQMQT